jgi:hypothetical protein
MRHEAVARHAWLVTLAAKYNAGSRTEHTRTHPGWLSWVVAAKVRPSAPVTLGKPKRGHTGLSPDLESQNFHSSDLVHLYADSGI